MLIHRAMTLALTVCLVATPLQISHAQPLTVADRQAQARPLSLNEAAALVQKRVGGRVLAADTRNSNGKTYYQIRVLVRKGQVKTYRVDPDSGRMY